ncbi:hypothetical protein BDD12DRAFT_982502 [Trichophaea hybrida]|nr:hypothetical protein BDD12DRAFT_982502 [Trichophaea hybrida]
MDPLSATASIVGVLALCVQVSNFLHTTIETIRDAPKAASNLLSRTNSVRLLLKQLQACSIRLRPEQLQLIDSTGIARCEETVTALSTLVTEASRKSSGKADRGGATSSELWAALKWLISKSDVEKLVEKMEKHIQDLSVILVMINLEVTTEIRDVGIGTRNSIESLERIVLEHRSVEMARMAMVVRSVASSRQAQLQVNKQLAWYGQILMPNTPYAQLRQNFAENAYMGNWKRLLELLVEANQVHRQWWINCIRPVTIGQDKWEDYVPSGYTPLHQAAWHGAPVHVIETLIQHGAWRTLRTTKGKYLTPLDIAKDYGWAHLYEILSPVIRHTVPEKILQALERQLYTFIGEEVGGEVLAQERTVLPPLCVLTEMERPELMVPFPLSEPGRDPPPPGDARFRGFLVFLDGRELVVQVFRNNDHPDRQVRIKEGDVEDIQGAILGMW